jgi:hypothetical protein
MDNTEPCEKVSVVRKKLKKRMKLQNAKNFLLRKCFAISQK